MPKGNSPVRGNVCKADKRVAVSARKLSSVCETEGFKNNIHQLFLNADTLRLCQIKPSTTTITANFSVRRKPPNPTEDITLMFKYTT